MNHQDSLRTIYGADLSKFPEGSKMQCYLCHLVQNVQITGLEDFLTEQEATSFRSLVIALTDVHMQVQSGFWVYCFKFLLES